MGQLVFQATLGGAVNLIGPNTASTINFTLPSADGTSGQALATNGTGTLAFSSFATLVSNTFTGSQTLSAGTANGVTYLNGSKVLTSGSALTFDGTKLQLSGTAATNTTSIGLVGSTTGYQRILMNNTSGGAQFGIEGSTASTICVGSAAYATVMGSYQNYPTQVITNNNVVATFDSAGNLGLGVTPSAWGTFKAIEIASAGSSVISAGSTDIRLTGNAYFNGTNWKYAATNLASMYAQNSGIHDWYIAASGSAGANLSWTTAMTLNASGNLGVGVTSPATRLEVIGATEGEYFRAGGGTISARSLQFSSFTVSGLSGVGHQINVPNASGVLTFATGSTERARIDSSGNLLVGKTSTSSANVGCELRSIGIGTFTAASNNPIVVNRTTTDGDLVLFRQDDAQEGTISVSGTTVSYNGGHLSRYAQTTTAKDNSLVKGTVLSNLDEMNVYTKDGQPVDNEQLNKVKVSDTEGDVNVAGVFVNWSHDEDHNVDEINMAMTGDMIIRIAQGVTVVRGDLLMSAGDGTAKPQGDDIIRSKTVAKVTSNHVTCTYADGSYCVPCVLMAC